MKRSGGILMHISSLPSRYGIGSLGKCAYDFVDFLCEAGQSCWQLLPLGPTSFGNSPYQSFSTFAGNPYFIDIDMLIEEGLLTGDEAGGAFFGDDPSKVDYEAIILNRMPLLRIAFLRGSGRLDPGFDAFRAENAAWLHDYALYMALRDHFGMKAWNEWEDEEIRLRRPGAMAKYRELLIEETAFYTYLQYLFFSQWGKLKEYALKKGIKMIGDLPIYVSMDSADVWAEPEFFQLDEEHNPIAIAGVPPDYFSETGQHWGNPLYDWDRMREDGWGWWIRRIDGAAKLYEVIRIDHFRGLASYWSIPAGEKTAVNGHWEKGPGIEFVNVIKNWFCDLEIIAEDLGILTEDVTDLLKESGYPGMKVLAFAFDPGGTSAYLPHNYTENCVCYTGTHDNDTLCGWLNAMSKEELRFADKYLGLNPKEGRGMGVIRGGMCSPAYLFVAQMQDWLELGSEARMNVPGTVGDNWSWRMLPGAATSALAAKIRGMTQMYGRIK